MMETRKILAIPRPRSGRRAYRAILVLALGLMVCQAEVSEAGPMGTAFTYQGRLIDANSAADGLYDFSFRLYDADVGGSKAANDVNVADVDVIDGYFTVELDFGSDVFNGNERWLELGVRPGALNDPNAYTTLLPRQQVTPLPYALSCSEVTGRVRTTGIYETVLYGDNWMARESNKHWYSVAMSADGTKQTAVVYPGQIYISTDYGNTWTAKESNRTWRSVAMSADGTKQTAVDYGGQIYISTDSGNTWTPRESNRGWYSVAMSADGTIQTAVDCGGQIYVSTDSGNTWTAKESNRGWLSVAMSADGTIQTAGGWYIQIYVSTDSGNTWTARESDREWYSVAMSADGTIQTAVDQHGHIYVSTDSGNTWTAKGGSGMWLSVAMSADGTIQTAVVNNGQIYVSWGNVVGIGTTSPTENLEVNGTVKATAFTGDGSALTGGPADADWTVADVNVYRETGSVGIGTTSPTERLEVNGTVKATAFTGDGSALTGVPADADWTVADVNVYRETGSVGIGTTSPTAKLDVAGNAAISGRVGIGTTNPGYKLSVMDGSMEVQKLSSGGNDGPYIKFREKGYNDVAGILFKASGFGNLNQLRFTVGAGNEDPPGQTQAMVIELGGNVGIGTTSPAGKLDVNGSIYQRGSVLHADYVFEPGYELESIEEHSRYMWENKHLKAIPERRLDESGQQIIEVGAHRKGIVEELEKAHIYIEQLHKRIGELQEDNGQMQGRIAKLEAIIGELAEGREGGGQ